MDWGWVFSVWVGAAIGAACLWLVRKRSQALGVLTFIFSLPAAWYTFSQSGLSDADQLAMVAAGLLVFLGIGLLLRL